MTHSQDRVYQTIDSLIGDGWIDDGARTHQNDRKLLRRGSARCTLGARTFFVWDLSNPQMCCKVPMKLGVDVVLGAAKPFGQSYQPDYLGAIAALEKIGKYENIKDVQGHAAHALERYYNSLRSEKPRFFASSLLEDVYRTRFDYNDPSTYGSWEMLAHWYCITEFELGAEIPEGQVIQVSWLISQVYHLETRTGNSKDQQMILIWQFAQWLAHASMTEIEGSIHSVYRQVQSARLFNKALVQA